MLNPNLKWLLPGYGSRIAFKETIAVSYIDVEFLFSVSEIISESFAQVASLEHERILILLLFLF